MTAIGDVNETQNVVAAFPTGSSKSLPQLLVSSLVSPGLVFTQCTNIAINAIHRQGLLVPDDYLSEISIHMFWKIRY